MAGGLRASGSVAGRFGLGRQQPSAAPKSLGGDQRALWATGGAYCSSSSLREPLVTTRHLFYARRRSSGRRCCACAGVIPVSSQLFVRSRRAAQPLSKIANICRGGGGSFFAKKIPKKQEVARQAAVLLKGIQILGLIAQLT